MRRRMALPKVRVGLRDGDDDSYAPRCMTIGPYHLERSCPEMEKEKMRCVDLVQSLSNECTLADLMGLMEEMEPLARECYGADGAVGDMTAEQLSCTLLNDGCFLLLFFVNYVPSNSTPSAGDSKVVRRLTAPATVSGNTLVRDILFLLENQIPLFVLQRLHERVTGSCSSPVLECIAGPVQQLLQQMHFISKVPRPAPPEASCHQLLHLVHAYFQPTIVLPAAGSNNTARLWRRPTGRWRRATEYRRRANVRFKLREFVDGVASSVLDVQLERGTMLIPRLRVDSNTWTILRNLMALEEQAEHRRRPVTAYCLFISQVACTEEDVKLLRRAGIVDHFLSDDEHVARGFADLCNGVVMDVDDSERNYLKPIWHELEERSRSRAQRFMGWISQGQNFAIAAVFLVALILVVCQVVQTFYVAAAGVRGQEH